MKEWLIPYVKQHLRGLLLSLALGVLALFCAAGLLFTSGYLISRAALRPENILMIYVPIVGVRAFGIFRAALQYAARLASHDTILRILSGMRTRLYRRLEPAALFLRTRFKSGDLLGALSDDIEHLQDLYLRTAIPAASALVIYAAWIGLLGWMDGTFALLMGLYLLILLVILPIFSVAWTKRLRETYAGKRRRLYETLTDAVLGATDWVLSGRRDNFLNEYEQLEQEAAGMERHLHRFVDVRDFISQLIIGGGVIALLAWSGRMTADGRMDHTLIAAFVLVVFTIAEALIPASEAAERMPSYHESFDRLARIKREAAVPGSSQAASPVELHAPIMIQAQDVSYHYADDAPWAVRHISLNIRQGEKIALIGRSGAGKSTLIHLLYGALAPSEGSITLNDVAAERIGREMTRYVSVLEQTPHLFDTSVKNNLALGNENASDQAIVSAAKAVGLHELIESLPQGYDSQMHEAGSIFSGGEQERLALARVLLRHTPIVILDEPTVGQDPLTERALLRTIFANLNGKTLIWITHHLVGAAYMDRIIFMENGSIEMQGPHHQLLRDNPRYRRLYRLDVPERPARIIADRSAGPGKTNL
ncbi:MAG: thiol reductant ABC exporter subunit CydC [Sporolactobacillus sp.]|jgi:ATP-binding cassette subfamily C protein CydC|nr:thiol reductant ABC exporter subunit CydC [Sporolactobacillus sp.]